MASQWPPKKNAAFTLPFTLYKNDGTTVNPSTITKYISKDGGYPATLTNTPTEVNGTLGLLAVTLTATEMNADRVWVYLTATVASTVPYVVTLYTAAYTNDEIAAMVDSLEGRLTATRASLLDSIATKAAITASVWGATTRSLTDKAGFSLADNAITATVITTSAASEIRTGLLTTASYTAAPSVASITASVWAAATRSLTASTFLTTAYEAAKTAAPASTALLRTTWTATLAGYLDAAISSRAAAASWTATRAAYLTGNVALAASLTTANTNIAAVLEDTGTTLPATLDTIDNFLDTEVAAILAAVDTEVAAIKAKTDNLPSDPADQSEVAALIGALPTAAENADAVWDEAIADHVTAGSAGKFLQRVYRYFFNKRTHTNASVVVYADDGTTADATMAVSGDTTTVTKAAPS